MKTTKEFISTFAHDVRNPLGGIIGTAELLDMQTSEMPDLNRKVKRILSAAHAIHALVNEFAKTFPVQEIDLAALAEELRDALREKYSVNTAIAQDADSYIVPLDPSLFRATFLELVSEALKAKQCGSLQISLEKEAESTISTITLNGSSPEGNIAIRFPSHTKE